MKEVIDIYDANRIQIGTADRLEAHLKGLWHATFHLWIVLRRAPACVLYQLRSPNTKSYPNYLDISTAGHLTTGESPLDGVREAREEIGLELDSKMINFLGWRVEVADQDNGHLNREHQAVYMVVLDSELDDFVPDPQEVYGLVKVPIDQGLRLHADLVNEVTCESVAFTNGDWVRQNRLVKPVDFLPGINRTIERFT